MQSSAQSIWALQRRCRKHPVERPNPIQHPLCMRRTMYPIYDALSLSPPSLPQLELAAAHSCVGGVRARRGYRAPRRAGALRQPALVARALHARPPDRDVGRRRREASAARQQHSRRVVGRRRPRRPAGGTPPWPPWRSMSPRPCRPCPCVAAGGGGGDGGGGGGAAGLAGREGRQGRRVYWNEAASGARRNTPLRGNQPP